MPSRAVRLPKLRKIDVRVPILLERGAGWDTPLFGAIDRAVLRSIDGRSTVHALAAALGRSDEEIAGTLAKLVRFRLVTMHEPTRRTGSPPPKRLDSGMRPALKTRPSEESLADVVPREPLPFDAPDGDAVDELGDDDVIVDEGEPEDRLTLPGIGPHGRGRAR